MDRTSIERELRTAEAALADCRSAAQTANEAVEQRIAAVNADDSLNLATDEVLSSLIATEDTAKAGLDKTQTARDSLLKILSRAPVSQVLTVNEPTPAGMIGMLKDDPRFTELARLAPGGSAIGSQAFDLENRAAVIRALRSGGNGFFAVGEGATGEALIAIDQRLIPPVEIPRRQVRLLDLITIGATDSNLVRYGKQTVRTDAAAPEALATSFPNATYTWATADATVENIGQYVKAPRETLLDVGALQTLVEQQLVYGVLLEAETLIYSGNGVGLNFQGIKTAAVAGGYSITRDTTNERRVSAIHRAITAVRKSLFADPDAIVMHPDDYHSLLVEESTSGGFLLNASRVPGESDILWGLPVVVTTLATAGEALVGNFKLGATLWVRSGAELQMSDSNEDDFLTRLIAFRAEFRAAFAVQRPHAFCTAELMT